MKTPKALQVTAEVGRCLLPPLPFLHYALTVALGKDLEAATSFKSPLNHAVDFGTRLFLRTGQPSLPQETKCAVVLTGVDSSEARREVGRGEAVVRGEGVQRVRLGLCAGLEGEASVQLEFSVVLVEVKQSKSINNRGVGFKSQISQKQSSSLSKDQPLSQTPQNTPQPPPTAPTVVQHSAKIQHNPLKVSNSQKMLGTTNQELQTSAATIRRDSKGQEPPMRSDDSETMLSLQIRIDQLQERLGEVNSKLECCLKELELLSASLAQEQARSRDLQTQKEELQQLLELEEMRSQLALSHINKLTQMTEHLGKPEGSFELIEEKDEIILLNQELQAQIASKNNTISSMQADLNQLRDKIALLQAKHTSTHTVINPAQPETTTTKKAPIVVHKQIQRVKPEKRLSDRNAPSWNKKHEDVTKETASSKQQPKPKDTDKRRTKNVPEPVKQPPPKPKETPKTAPVPMAKTMQRVRSSKGIKVEQRPTMETEKTVVTQKRSSLQSLGSLALELDQLAEATNLMIDSRATELTHELPS